LNQFFFEDLYLLFKELMIDLETSYSKGNYNQKEMENNLNVLNVFDVDGNVFKVIIEDNLELKDFLQKISKIHKLDIKEFNIKHEMNMLDDDILTKIKERKIDSLKMELNNIKEVNKNFFFDHMLNI